MDNKRSKNVVNLASKLDAMIDGDGEYTKLAFNIVENNDNSATREICRNISELTETENRQTIQVAKALKDAIINYYGYLNVKEICNGHQHDVFDEDEKTLDELLKELNELVGLNNVKSIVNDLIIYQKMVNQQK